MTRTLYESQVMSARKRLARRGIKLAEMYSRLAGEASAKAWAAPTKDSHGEAATVHSFARNLHTAAGAAEIAAVHDDHVRHHMAEALTCQA